MVIRGTGKKGSSCFLTHTGPAPGDQHRPGRFRRGALRLGDYEPGGAVTRERKIITSVYLDAAQRRRLVDLSEKTKVPKSVYIRQGIDMVLDYHEIVERRHREEEERRR